MSEIIKESEIKRIQPPALREKLKLMGANFIFCKSSINYTKYQEAILLCSNVKQKVNFPVYTVNPGEERKFAERDDFESNAYNYSAEWFDIAAPEMRDMTPKEAILWCKKNGNTICQLGSNMGVLLNPSLRESYRIDGYGYMDDNGDFHKFPQTEVSE